MSSSALGPPPGIRIDCKPQGKLEESNEALNRILEQLEQSRKKLNERVEFNAFIQALEPLRHYHLEPYVPLEERIKRRFVVGSEALSQFPKEETILPQLEFIGQLRSFTKISSPHELTAYDIFTKLLNIRPPLEQHTKKSKQGKEIFRYFKYYNVSGMHLPFLHFSSISEQIEELIIPAEIAQKCKRLTLPLCRISDKILQKIVSQLPVLEELVLFLCCKLKGTALQNLKNLSSLYMFYSPNVKPTALISVIQNCSTLQKVEIIHRRIRPPLAETLAGHPTLHHIDLSYCPLIGEAEELLREKTVLRKSSTSSLAYAVQLITGISQISRDEAQKGYLEVIENEASLMIKNGLSPAHRKHFNESKTLKTLFQSDTDRFLTAVSKIHLFPDAAASFAKKEKRDIDQLTAYYEATRNFTAILQRISKQYPFIPDPLHNFLAIKKSSQLQEKITSLDFKGSDLTQPPLLSLPSLKILHLSHNPLTSLGDLEKLPLQTLLLQKCGISSLPIRLLEQRLKNPHLGTLIIYLQGNPIDIQEGSLSENLLQKVVFTDHYLLDDPENPPLITVLVDPEVLNKIRNSKKDSSSDEKENKSSQ